jgi:CubicO group peptidase (beta-lactamase class C family)
LLGDRAKLEAKVTEIVAPFLLRPEDGAAPAGAADKDSPKDNDEAKNVQQAWAIVVGIVSKDGKHVFGFGRMSAKDDTRPDGRTVFEIGSVTKTFTALLLADLVERKKLNLDDSVRLYLPDSVTAPKRGDKEITLRHLATHTSGLPSITLAIALQGMENPYKNFGTKALYETLNTLPLARDPGERYEYSNMAYGLLGHVLSRQAEKDYEALVVERICTPLELHDTRIGLSAEQRKRFAPPHDGAGRASSTWEFDAIAGAGALRSTADDMLRYLEANMGLKKTDLLPAMRLGHQYQREAGHKIKSIGLGWHMEKRGDDARLIFHGGGTGGYGCLVGFLEENGEPKFGIAVLSNASPAANGMAANDVAIKLIEALHDSKW